MNKPTLVILAAGMGSRFGGTKQLSGFGPHQHLIIDYTIYDALLSGFKKIVIVIRKELESEFKTTLIRKWKNKVEFSVVYQELNSLPEKYTIPSSRTKPWGTAHAVWMAENEVDNAFVIVNADDFYGREALLQAASMLKELNSIETTAFIIGYKLNHTLSPNGAVSRGICITNENSELVKITELTSIIEKDGNIFAEINGEKTMMHDNYIVSMNLMGFSSTIFDVISRGFESFYNTLNSNCNAEFYLAEVLNNLLMNGFKIPVITTESQWFGVTYSEDALWVNARLIEMHTSGIYPDDLRFD